MPLHPQEPPACIELLIFGAAGRYFVTDQLRATDALRRMADPGEGMVDFDGDASARLQRTDPPIAVRSDGLRYAPRADARFARHTHLLIPR